MTENIEPGSPGQEEAPEPNKPAPTQDHPVMVKDAYSAAKELRVENDRMEKNITSLRNLQAIDQLGGRSNTGVQADPAKQLTPEEKKKQQAGTYFKDTALGDAIDKT